jgi:hypothetical protein
LLLEIDDVGVDPEKREFISTERMKGNSRNFTIASKRNPRRHPNPTNQARSFQPALLLAILRFCKLITAFRVEPKANNFLLFTSQQKQTCVLEVACLSA